MLNRSLKTDALTEDQVDHLKEWINCLRNKEEKFDAQVANPHRQLPYLKQPLNAEELFSPLGILCELAIKNGVPVDVDSLNGIPSYDFYTIELPHSVREWIGQRAGNPLGRYDLTFKEAANIIEQQMTDTQKPVS